MERQTHRRVLGWLSLAIVLAGCKTDGANLSDDTNPGTDALAATDAVDGDGQIQAQVPLKVDLLLVLEGRPSTCRRLNQFAAGLEPFVATVQQTLAADMRVAVTTTDVLTEDAFAIPSGYGIQGRFNRMFATEYPSACAERVAAECQYDFQCQGDPLNLGDRWLCESATGGYFHMLNLDGSLNSACRFQCDTTQDCLDVFVSEDTPAADVARWTCLTRGSQSSEYSCVQGPVTADCPDDLPAVVAYPPTLDAAQVAALVEPPADGATVASVPDLSMNFGVCADYVYNCRDCEGAAAKTACRTERQCDRYEAKTCAAIAVDDVSGRALCAQQCVFANFARDVRCIASVGASQNSGGGLKAGLKAAWLALDPQGANAQQLCLAKPAPELESDPARKVAAQALLAECFRCQDTDGFGAAVGDCPSGYGADCDVTNPACRRFLREDAYLVFVLLTDEDDCSIDDGKQILTDDFPICGVLGDSGQDPESLSSDLRLKSAGWNAGEDYQVPLAPIQTYADRFNSLVPGHSERFLMAVVSGDADVCFDHEAEAAQKFADRFASEYWCTAYRPDEGTTCWAEYYCYRSQADPAMAEQAAACIAEQGEAAALECYQMAIAPEIQPAIDQCLAEYRANPEVQRLFAERPEVAENLRHEVCQAGQPLSTELQREVYRQRFHYSLTDPENPLSENSAVCTNDKGRAYHARRLLQFVANLGPNGFFQNICSSEGLDVGLAQLGQNLAARLGSLAAGQTRR